jgi:carbamoyltransferase
MLFNAKVRSHLLPAVTHVDRSARIQTVDPSCGQFYRLLEAFSSLTEVPVVLNTSLNGHDEPIVETPADAIQLLLEQDIDVLFLQGRRVERSATAARTSI